MPLLDHFHPPLAGHRHWQGFHGRWAAAMADDLDERLPPEYFTEFQVTLGTRFEVDVGTFSEPGAVAPDGANGGPVPVQTRVWAPPAPVAVIPAAFPDDIEVQVFSNAAGPVRVAAIELVSPANKDREETRRAFVAKCASYLQRGIGLIVVDIVTSRHANLHDDLTAYLGQTSGPAFPTETPLYATAYRPVHRGQENAIDLWRESLVIGGTLLTLPLAVRGLGTLPVDLESSYTEARKRVRIP
jgi:hypothetical protein